MILREMEIDDLEQVMVIENENFATPWTETGFFTFLIREDALFLVAEEEGKILGYCGVLMVLDEGDITKVSVDKDCRGRGIGKALVKEMIARTSWNGINTLHLEVRQSNLAALSLYEKEGFVGVGIRKGYYQDPVEDAVVMDRKEVR